MRQGHTHVTHSLTSSVSAPMACGVTAIRPVLLGGGPGWVPPAAPQPYHHLGLISATTKVTASLIPHFLLVWNCSKVLHE